MRYQTQEKVAWGGFITIGVMIISTLVVWGVNAFKLAGLIMAMNWQNIASNNWGSIIVHAIGLIGPAAWVTVWF